MKQETKPQDTSTRKDELPENICKHCGEPYTTQERNRVYGNNVLMGGYCSAGCYTQGTLAPVRDELSITPGEWRYKNPERTLHIIDTDGSHVVYHQMNGTYTKNDMRAICTSINSTYKKGYNPAAMEELYKALEMVNKYYEDSNHDDDFGSMVSGSIDIIVTALTNAKL